MGFDEFLNQAWSNHATKASEVAQSFNKAVKLIDKDEQIPQMAQLVAHVLGEHLGQWESGVATLKQLQQLPFYKVGTESEKAIIRSIASLELASGKRDSVDDLSKSDQIRALTISASALCGQKDAPKAQRFFRQALEKAESGLPKEDLANRALAVTGNNLASTLEEQPSLNAAETELMILAAQTGRKFWAIAGTWLQIERAEYRLSQTYLKAGNFVLALKHAQACLELIQLNNAPALEFFFAYEALALAEKAGGNTDGFVKATEQVKLNFEKLSDEEKTWCETSLKKLFV